MADQEEPGVEAELERVALALEGRQLYLSSRGGQWRAEAAGLEALEGRTFLGYGATPTLAVANLGRQLRQGLGE